MYLREFTCCCMLMLCGWNVVFISLYRRKILQRQQASANWLGVPTFTYPESCPINGTQPVCNSTTPYRTFDGSCNNLINPAWGQSRRPQLRLISAQYNRGKFTLFARKMFHTLAPSVISLKWKLMPGKVQNHKSVSSSLTGTWCGSFTNIF